TAHHATARPSLRHAEHEGLVHHRHGRALRDHHPVLHPPIHIRPQRHRPHPRPRERHRPARQRAHRRRERLAPRHPLPAHIPARPARAHREQPHPPPAPPLATPHPQPAP